MTIKPTSTPQVEVREVRAYSPKYKIIISISKSYERQNEYRPGEWQENWSDISTIELETSREFAEKLFKEASSTIGEGESL